MLNAVGVDDHVDPWGFFLVLQYVNEYDTLKKKYIV